MRGIVKRFPGVIANDQVDFDLRRGEVHALLGENGAGKCTLMNILAGLYQPDEGTIAVDGEPVALPLAARRHRGRHRAWSTSTSRWCPSLTVAENILLGLDEPRFRLPCARSSARDRGPRREVGLRVDPGGQGLAALGRRAAAGRDPQDALPRRAHADPGRAHRRARAAGGRGAVPDAARRWPPRAESIVFISHKLDEVLAIADRVTVLRAGRSRPAASPAAGRDAREPRPPDGRAGRARDRRRATPSTPGRGGAPAARTCSARERPRPAGAAGRLAGRPRGRDRGRRGRRRQRPVASWPRSSPACAPAPARVTVDGEERRQPAGPRAPSRPAWRTCPRTAHGTGLAPGLSIVGQPDHEELPRAPIARGRFADRRRGAAQRAEDAQGRLRGRGARRRHPGAPAVRRQPPAAHPRARVPSRAHASSSPSSRRAAWTSGAIETVHRLLLDRRDAGAACC